MFLQRTLNPLGLAILNLIVVQDVRKTRISELSVISSEERGFKKSLKTSTISSRLVAYRQHFFFFLSHLETKFFAPEFMAGLISWSLLYLINTLFFIWAFQSTL